MSNIVKNTNAPPLITPQVGPARSVVASGGRALLATCCRPVSDSRFFYVLSSIAQLSYFYALRIAPGTLFG